MKFTVEINERDARLTSHKADDESEEEYHERCQASEGKSVLRAVLSDETPKMRAFESTMFQTDSSEQRLWTSLDTMTKVAHVLTQRFLTLEAKPKSA